MISSNCLQNASSQLHKLHNPPLRLLRLHSFAYLMGAVWLRCAHQDFGGLRYRHHSSQSKPWADSGYSSISKVSYLMLSKEGDTTRVRSSLIRCRIGSALSGSRASAACVKKKKGRRRDDEYLGEGEMMIRYNWCRTSLKKSRLSHAICKSAKAPLHRYGCTFNWVTLSLSMCYV